MQVLIFVILCITFIAAEQTIKLQILPSSNTYYLAVAPLYDVLPTTKVEIKEALPNSEQWSAMRNYYGGYWDLVAPSTETGFRFPLSIRLTSANGNVVIASLLSAATLSLPILDLGVQYASATRRPPPMSTTAPITPTKEIKACSGNMKIMVPLYSLPGADWDLVAHNGRLVKTVAIIKAPTSQAPDNVYVEYMQKLHDAGVDMIGYVDTIYGTRSEAEVKADIDVYATQYPLLSGVFLDRASASATKHPYYQTLYAYITAMPGWTYDVVNPGMIPDPLFKDVATQLVTFADYGAALVSSSAPSWASCENKDKFVAIAHTVNANDLLVQVNTLINKNYIGYIYVTDGSGDYNALSSYYATLVANIVRAGAQ